MFLPSYGSCGRIFHNNHMTPNIKKKKEDKFLLVYTTTDLYYLLGSQKAFVESIFQFKSLSMPFACFFYIR